MGWLQSHVYIAAWVSPVITLVGIFIRNTIRPDDKVNWSMLVIYVGFLTCLAAILTPGIELAVRSGAYTVGGIAFGIIMLDAVAHRKNP